MMVLIASAMALNAVAMALLTTNRKQQKDNTKYTYPKYNSQTGKKAAK